MKMIKDIIAKLDVVLAQVLIDAIIMEINLTGTAEHRRQLPGPAAECRDSFTGAGGLNNLSSAASGFLTGSDRQHQRHQPPCGSGSTLANLPGGFSYFAKFGNDLNVVLEAVAGDSRVNVLSRPRIQTSHAVPADLFIGNTVPYVTGTYNYGYGCGPSSQYTQLEVGIHLQVLPLINPDGLVVMDIQADVEQLGPGVQIAGVGSVPTTTKRQAGAKVAVRNGETIILGGFISDSRTLSDSGIPWLEEHSLAGQSVQEHVHREPPHRIDHAHAPDRAADARDRRRRGHHRTQQALRRQAGRTGNSPGRGRPQRGHGSPNGSRRRTPRQGSREEKEESRIPRTSIPTPTRHRSNPFRRLKMSL